jgi:hypothetical protein
LLQGRHIEWLQQHSSIIIIITYYY